MKNKTRKWLKYGRLAGVLFVLSVLAFAIRGSFAAYTNFNSVKRVVSTGTQSDTMFGSNYLPLVSSVENEYSIKRIALAETGGDYTFTVIVCNYIWGDDKSYNPKDITYTMTAQIVSVDGESLPKDITEISVNGQHFDATGKLVLSNQELNTGAANTIEYKFVMPQDLKNKVRIQMVAEASDDSKDAVNSRKLAAVLSFADYEITKSWSGHFIDSRDLEPDDYDAFNYEIYGNGAGTVTITWPDSLQLSKWATNGEQVTTGTYSFKVDESTTAKQFQFYRNPDRQLELTGTGSAAKWSELESMIKVTFTTEKVDANENIQE